MRLLLIGLLIVVLFVGSIVGTFTVLQHFDVPRQPHSSGDGVTPSPTTAEPTAQPAANTPPPATPAPVIEPTATPTMPLSFSVTTNKQQYRVGNLLSLAASSNQTCYLLLYDVDPQGKAARFFPNSFIGEPRLFAGEQRRIPGDDVEYDLPMEGPAGSGYIHAVCSWQPVQGMFEVYQTREDFAAALQQHVYTQPAGQWVETKIPYQIIR